MMLNREFSLPIDIIAGKPPVHPETQCPIQYMEWITYTVNKMYDFVYIKYFREDSKSAKEIYSEKQLKDIKIILTI